MVVSRAFDREEGIDTLEGRAAVRALKYQAENGAAAGDRTLELLDSMCNVLALSKGRSSAPGLGRICRQWAAVALSWDLYPRVRWIPGEKNPSDGSSRAHHAVSSGRRGSQSAAGGARGRPTF